ncbi:MAG: S9 family peptidase, partial [Alphaproteobacteria bacterium]
EMRGRIKEDDSSVPTPDGPWDYYMRFAEDAEHPLYCRSRRGQPDSEQVLLDSHAASLQHPFFRITGMAHSPDHRRLATATDITGSEYSLIRILDMESGEWLADEIASAQGDVVWSADSATLFYTWLDDNHRPAEVRRHTLGQTGDDARVYAEADSAFYLGVGKTESGRLIVIDAHDHSTAELHIVPADAPDTPPVCFRPRRHDQDYDLSDHGERVYLRTNIACDGTMAEDYRIVATRLDQPDPAHWTEVVPHRPGTLILAMLVFRDWLVWHEREDGMPRIVVRHIATGDEHSIAMDEEVFDLAPRPGYEFATDTLRFVFSSPRTPAETFDYDMATRQRTLRKTQEVPSGHDPADYQTRRLMVPAHDGEQVPVSLLWHRDTPLDGTAPVLLYGYGSYGITIPMAFTTNRFSLVNRGFIYAHAHIRGGKDRG